MSSLASCINFKPSLVIAVTMHYTSALLYVSSIAVGSLVAAAPLCSNVTDTAGGGLPNFAKPTMISASAVKDLQLALFLENLETTYFLTGVGNITKWGVRGYRNDTVGIVSKIAAVSPTSSIPDYVNLTSLQQEEVHIATLADLLEAYDAPLIPPCNYSFPVNSTREFFELADIITSVGIGATIGLADRLAVTDPELINVISSILTVESRHDAFFRHINGKVPNPAPFDTGISDIWAYNLALSFIVPGSCPIEVPVPILPALNVSDPSWSGSSYTSTNAATLQFTWDPLQATFVAEADKQLLVGWVNQLNVPVYTALNITAKGTGTAAVPPGMNGAVFAAVTTQQPDNVDDLALATLAGPVVLIVS
jgi:hypothetical protein